MAYTDAEVIAQLKVRRDNIVDELAAIAVTTAGGLPDSGVPHSIQHKAHKMGLWEELKNIRQLLAELEGGFTIVSEATT